MPSLYDRVSKHLGSEKSEGVTALDIADLPEPQQKILFLLLRDQTAATKGLSLEELQGKLKTPVENITDVMATLHREGWLIVMGDEAKIHYKVNLRRKRGAAIGRTLWAITLERLTATPSITIAPNEPMPKSESLPDSTSTPPTTPPSTATRPALDQ